MLDGAGHQFEKLDKQTWRVTAHGTVTIRYATYWDEAGPFATQLNGEHAFINPAMILMYVPERASEGVRWCLQDLSAGWTVRALGFDCELAQVRTQCASTRPNYDAWRMRRWKLASLKNSRFQGFGRRFAW